MRMCSYVWTVCKCLFVFSQLCDDLFQRIQAKKTPEMQYSVEVSDPASFSVSSFQYILQHEQHLKCSHMCHTVQVTQSSQVWKNK